MCIRDSPNRDAQILAHILEYCNRIEKTLSRFGREFDVFLEDQDYMDSVSMNLLQILSLIHIYLMLEGTPFKAVGHGGQRFAVDALLLQRQTVSVLVIVLHECDLR